MRQITLLLLVAAGLVAADATGTWTGTLTHTADDGTPKTGPAHLVLKQDGSKLSGTAGPDTGEQRPIQKGKAENGKLTFEVPAGAATMKFVLQQEGDEMKGEVTRDRDGEKRTAQLAVKRAQ